MRYRVSLPRSFAVFLGTWALVAWGSAAAADPLAVVNRVRMQSCGASAPLERLPALDSAARRIAEGGALHSAVQASGYRARSATLLTLGDVTRENALVRAVAQSCGQIAQAGLRDVGLHRRGSTLWLVVAEPFTVPALDAAATAARVLDLVNRARAQPRRCGTREFTATRPLRWSSRLERAAAAHARDMAARGSMSHTGSDGSAPSQRVARTGYAWASTGENVAAGQRDADAVVGSWLSSPGHCANVMSPDYTEMAVAFATNPRSDAGIYWTQVFGTPLTRSAALPRR
jgi:uncharacterized protein YkwD